MKAVNLYGPDDAPRIALKVDRKEGGSIQLFQPDWQLAIHLGHRRAGWSIRPNWAGPARPAGVA